MSAPLPVIGPRQIVENQRWNADLHNDIERIESKLAELAARS